MSARQRILLVEDEEAMVAGLEYALRREGFEVAVARDGEAALQALREGAPDLVLLDVMLPRRSGFEVLPLTAGGPTVIMRKDVDFGRNQITVRRGKGDKDRATMLPISIKAELAAHLERARAQHQRDLANGAGWVDLPGALAKKLPSAGCEWPWQWVFPATRLYVERDTGQARRHHLHETVVQHAVRSSPQASPSARRATRFATPSLRTFSKTAATSAPSKSCSATRMSPRP